jgi:hypothetical protein
MRNLSEHMWYEAGMMMDGATGAHVANAQSTVTRDIVIQPSSVPNSQ